MESKSSFSSGDEKVDKKYFSPSKRGKKKKKTNITKGDLSTMQSHLKKMKIGRHIKELKGHSYFCGILMNFINVIVYNENAYKSNLEGNLNKKRIFF